MIIEGCCIVSWLNTEEGDRDKFCESDRFVCETCCKKYAAKEVDREIKRRQGINPRHNLHIHSLKCSCHESKKEHLFPVRVYSVTFVSLITIFRETKIGDRLTVVGKGRTRKEAVEEIQRTRFNNQPEYIVADYNSDVVCIPSTNGLHKRKFTRNFNS